VCVWVSQCVSQCLCLSVHMSLSVCVSLSLYMAKSSLEALIEQDMDKIEELHGLATELDQTWAEAIENARLQPVPSGGNRYENYQ